MVIFRYPSKGMDGLENVQDVDWNTNASNASSSDNKARWNIVDMFRKNSYNDRAASTIVPQRKQKKTDRNDLQRKSMPPTLDKLKLNAGDEEQQQVISTNTNGGEGRLPRTVSFHHRSCPNICFGPLDILYDHDTNTQANDSSSVVSEVTLMTYSNEEAAIIKEEFIKQLKLTMKQNTKQLSLAEKEVLLREIKEEQEQKFLRQYAIDKIKTKKNKFHCDHTESPPPAPSLVLEKSNALQLQTHHKMNDKISPRARPRVSTQDNRFSSFCPETHGTSVGPQDQEENDQESNHQDDEMVQQDPEFAQTEEQQQDGQVSLQDEHFIAGEPQLVDNKKLPNIVQEDEEFLSTSTSSSSKARISDIIELKLLIANQQAAIDTLSYKLHNLELAHRRLELDASKG